MKIRSLMVLLMGMPALSAAAQGPPPAVLPAVAQPPGGYTVDIRRLSSPPTIDGKLDDAAWQEAAELGDFVQDNPDTGQPATQKTAVRIGYDARYLYLGIRCFDTEPGKIIAPVLERDGDLSNDDSVYVMLDTFHDGRNAFLFATNPQG
ncbi:MAG TPA: carbohydrate binding family 9 domain-containing protein, partial [Thermoanaerobaculia bacterium]|nr:carbohydrate binding family 9 domain-containing protein [Thermoanaerobaculia bacterium]